jgi:hypothetical protein
MAGKVRVDWIALVVSIAAVGFSGLQWYETKKGTQLANSAALGFEIDTQLEKNRYGIGVRNAGPGVARIRAVAFYVDRKKVDDLVDVMEAAGLDSQRDYGVELDVGDALAPGDTNWFVNYRPRNKQDGDKAETFIEDHLQVAVDYCTANGECSRMCSQAGGC